MPTWTSEQVATLAPDAASVSAARGLAGPHLWTGGRSRRAGGVGPVPVVPVGGRPGRPRLRLHVPEPEDPLQARPRPAPPVGGDIRTPFRRRRRRPGSRSGWPSGPSGRPGRRRRAAEKKPVDPEARAKRMADRAARIGAGLQELDLWLRDLVRHGLASVQHRPFSYWDDVAARMVDAQAPGVASQVRRMAGIVRSGDGWPGRLLAHAGRLHLLAEAWTRLDDLPPRHPGRPPHRGGLVVDERGGAGRARPRSVTAGRSWPGRSSTRSASASSGRGSSGTSSWRRTALILDFAGGTAPLPSDLVVGTAVDADLAFFPGSSPQRALVATTHAAAEPIDHWPGAPTLDDALASARRRPGRQPVARPPAHGAGGRGPGGRCLRSRQHRGRGAAAARGDGVVDAGRRLRRASGGPGRRVVRRRAAPPQRVVRRPAHGAG